MKNILQDLKERLSDAANRRSALSEQVVAVDIEIDTIKRMLDLEMRLQADTPGNNLMRSPISAASPPSAGDFVRVELRDGPKSKNELRELGVERGVFESKTAGRSLHATLINLARGNRVVILPGGKYGLPGNESPRSDNPAGAS